MTPRPRNRRRTAGFSTMEVLAGASLALSILGVATSFFTAQQRAMRVQSTFTDSQNVTRTFTDLLGRELRQASYDPTGIGAGGAIAASTDVNWCPGTDQGLTVATTNSIRFKQDLNGDGDTADTGEDVYYYLSGNQILRKDGGNAGIALVTGVPDVGLSLRYFNGSDPPVELMPTNGALSAGQRDCVAKVLITVQSSLPSPDPTSSVPLKSTSQLEIALRSRSLNNF
jgi:type II secretory pathway component PulJ